MSRLVTFAFAGLIATSAAQAAPTTDAGSYVAQAGASDLYEKTSSQLVLANAQRADVRRFAQMMIDDHGKTTQQVVAAAKQDRVTAGPPAMTAEQTQMIKDLRAATGAQRESLYVQQQVKAHQQALDLHRSFANGGSTPMLKKVAGGAVPIIQKHVEMVTNLAAAPAVTR
ncbi:DUF4142 domain-containing protein [Polymorphobacter fuscus]|uniref:DUF4142 domain-containing protein n=1 Tax=Sandarakinorhabdus fusca TaxID=1439888 RepID=A0A7C9GPK8_9SPHN|nr:DUF4142 domain-containing protein [Polymorphobacter fuscus]KAB7646382.1 DUF4142 domain-containing protein [Polymorphobacter fuscus]MQT17612.1 DUF4142 domain-containing protein [Polymorphobacter fuscus]NJC09845.1 putative membrane protein [Polymorphobacter fuscus]